LALVAQVILVILEVTELILYLETSPHLAVVAVDMLVLVELVVLVAAVVGKTLAVLAQQVKVMLAVVLMELQANMLQAVVAVRGQQVLEYPQDCQ
jgi:hypothetical protein